MALRRGLVGSAPIANGRRQVVYVRRELKADERQAAVRRLLETNGEAPIFIDNGQVYYAGAPETAPDAERPDDFEPSDVIDDVSTEDVP